MFTSRVAVLEKWVFRILWNSSPKQLGQCVSNCRVWETEQFAWNCHDLVASKRNDHKRCELRDQRPDDCERVERRIRRFQVVKRKQSSREMWQQFVRKQVVAEEGLEQI
ncbi:hypothetical protein BLNAU_17205 [Blattamonas nauphoetae]|uniref:Uncharacterized protein n=1 Tax=Blattamonas nauphoetae TaxID=2049346 RepID=A0ABQ9X9K5_9EUKA|nr:hypothetical protein BLNAU_17205 [Blattamonas nauphoetae]